MRRMRVTGAILAWAGLLVGGCASYHHRLIEPVEFAGAIRTEDFVTSSPPIRCVWNTVEDRLVVRVFNDGEEDLLLDGARSVLVDPAGQSRPLRSLTIAPGSFARLVLPPYRSIGYASGPMLSVGVGVSSGGGRYYPPLSPPSTVIVGDRESSWDWPAGGVVRLSLQLARDGQSFSRAFVIERREGR